MEEKTNKICQIIKEKPYLIWHVKNYKTLSLKSMVESILNYGDWQDFKKLKQIIGVNKLATIFSEISNAKRVNLRLPTISYFTKYFNKYAE